MERKGIIIVSKVWWMTILVLLFFILIPVLPCVLGMLDWDAVQLMWMLLGPAYILVIAVIMLFYGRAFCYVRVNGTIFRLKFFWKTMCTVDTSMPFYYLIADTKISVSFSGKYIYISNQPIDGRLLPMDRTGMVHLMDYDWRNLIAIPYRDKNLQTIDMNSGNNMRAKGVF